MVIVRIRALQAPRDPDRHDGAELSVLDRSEGTRQPTIHEGEGILAVHGIRAIVDSVAFWVHQLDRAAAIVACVFSQSGFQRCLWPFSREGRSEEVGTCFGWGLADPAGRKTYLSSRLEQNIHSSWFRNPKG